MPLNNPPTSLLPVVKRESRDTADPTGDVGYTGYGFQPSGLIIIFAAGTAQCIGSSEPGLTETMFQCTETPDIEVDAGKIIMLGLGGNIATAVVKTYDADGFTLTWTKTGVPTGVKYFTVFAFK